MRTTNSTAMTVLAAAALVVLFTGVAAAEELVHFTNGTSMPVVGHEVDGDMIRVDLGEDGWLGFPRSQVEWIESAGREVFPSEGSVNRIVDRTPTYPQTGRKPRNRPGVGFDTPPVRNPAVTTGSGGVPTYHRRLGSSNPAARRVGTVAPAYMRSFGTASEQIPVTGGRGPVRTSVRPGVGPQRVLPSSSTTGGRPFVTGLERRGGSGGKVTPDSATASEPDTSGSDDDAAGDGR